MSKAIICKQEEREMSDVTYVRRDSGVEYSIAEAVAASLYNTNDDVWQHIDRLADAIGYICQALVNSKLDCDVNRLLLNQLVSGDFEQAARP